MALSRFFPRTSIRNQLMAIILGTSGLGLGLGSVAVVTWESHASRGDLANRSRLFAQVAGDSSIISLVFEDWDAAEEDLAKLEAVPEVLCARLFDRRGRLVAAYRDLPCGDRAPTDAELELQEPRFESGHVVVASSLEHEGTTYGSLRMAVSARFQKERTRRTTQLMVALMTFLILLSAAMAYGLQRMISRPLLRLAHLAKKITHEADVSIRASNPPASEEIATLYDAWNEMLDLIERRSRESERYQAALARNESRFRGIIESSRNAIFVILHNRLVYVNPQFRDAFGYSEDELTSPAFDPRCLVTSDSQPLLPAVSNLGSGAFPEPLRYEIRGLSKSGESLDFEITVSLVEWDHDIAIMGVLHNITERKLAELRREQELLRYSNQQLERYAHALESSNRQLEHFAYVASHDLQEPLRTVSSFVQLLARRYRGRLDDDADDFIGYVVDGAQRMQALIEGLLAFSRINSERPLEDVDCEQVLATVRRNLGALLDESGAVLECGPLPTVGADVTQLTQLFQNLINNAIKFHGEDPPRIWVSAQRGTGEWTFAVEDNGLGIEDAYRERIFAMFQRLHDQENYPGTGIGLAICKRIVERHHGRIWVESEYGRGSTFFFTFPATAGDADGRGEQRPGRLAASRI